MSHDRGTTLLATYRIVTPMFCAGADQNSAELRLPSFKGALRFWWRSLMWGKVSGVDELRRREAELFGASDQKTGQSKVRMTLRWVTREPEPSQWIEDWPRNQPAMGSTYLGFGITESGRRGSANPKPHRRGLPEGGIFEVRCWVPTEYVEVLTSSLRLLGTFGGLGSRSRRGFGSVALEQLNQADCSIQTASELNRLSASHIQNLSDSLPTYTAFSAWSRIYIGPASRSAREAHNALGEQYRNFRGMPSPLRGKSKIPIGLPLQGIDSRRRASPLIMHIHPVAETFVPIVLFLPAQFHPEIEEGNELKFYRVIHDWMVTLNAQEVKLG